MPILDIARSVFRCRTLGEWYTSWYKALRLFESPQVGRAANAGIFDYNKRTLGYVWTRWVAEFCRQMITTVATLLLHSPAIGNQ